MRAHSGKVADGFRHGQKIVLFSATAMQLYALYATPVPLCIFYVFPPRPALFFCNNPLRYLSVGANSSGDYRNFFLPAGPCPT